MRSVEERGEVGEREGSTGEKGWTEGKKEMKVRAGYAKKELPYCTGKQNVRGGEGENNVPKNNEGVNGKEK